MRACVCSAVRNSKFLHVDQEPPRSPFLHRAETEPAGVLTDRWAFSWEMKGWGTPTWGRGDTDPHPPALEQTRINNGSAHKYSELFSLRDT